jgi:hypothetical protein
MKGEMMKKSIGFVALLAMVLVSCSPSAKIDGSVATLKNSPLKGANFVQLMGFVMPEADMAGFKSSVKEGKIGDAEFETMGKYEPIAYAEAEYAKNQEISLNIATGEVKVNGKVVSVETIQDYGFDFANKKVPLVSAQVAVADAKVDDKIAIVWVLVSGNESTQEIHLMYIADKIQNDSIYTVE